MSKFKMNPTTGQLDMVNRKEVIPIEEQPYKTLEVVLTQTNIDQGYKTVSVEIRSPETTLVSVRGAPTQTFGIDYTVTFNKVIFEEGIDDDGLLHSLTEGDVLTILYK